ncbi:TPA: hypothetical protein QEM39_003744 [Pseudomonas putida]|uniref:hypothetical protein n=1 Tax=Pseudomonas putida TaxID=303 RepID=UPI002363FECC|nr:hypothetical protein [Pseudomonas putida]MDD2149960.1 hypothetical protein [Pseudomonas putida]HDS1682165.1 hypothetical protein [Pseudomonas putida]
MVFQHVELSDQRKIESTSSDCETIQTFCGYLLDELRKFYELSHIKQNYNVTFAVRDGLVCAISTPFGNARGRLDIHLAGDELAGRYVFEKSVVAEDGRDIWVPVWAIRISRYGDVRLGDEGEIAISVTNVGPFSNAISAPGKSLLYRIASTPLFSK